MSTSTASDPTLTEALLARGFSHRKVGSGPFHQIVRISDGLVMTTVKANEAWEYVHAFDRQVAKLSPLEVDAVLDVTLGAELAEVSR